MIDHLLGRPSTRLKRFQVLLVLSFWGWILRIGPRDGPSKIPFVKRMNAYAKRFTPWQIFVFALTSVYAIRHLDAVAGFGAPEPLARMYSRSFYRATWINTALDAGFASAMSIRPQWVRDIASVLMSLYYVIYANEADEKLRKYRAFCTVDFLRATWNKTSNPYIRAITWLSFHRISIAESILLPRPSIGAHNKRPIRAKLFYHKPLRFLREEDELIIDFVGGGFVSMRPEHHEDRLRQLAAEHKRPILAVDYCKAPEYPYPYALEECFDLFRSLHECKGSVLGMSGRSTFRTILTGDSAGGNLALGVMLKILEYPQAHIKSAYAAKAAGGPGSAPPPLPRPIALILNYPATNFAFTSWMKPDHLNVLRSQSEVNLQLIEPMRGKNEGKDSVDSNLSARNRLRGRTRPTGSQTPIQQKVKPNKSYTSLANQAEMHLAERARMAEAESSPDVTPQTSWIGRIESDEMDRQASTMNDPEHQQRLAQQRELQAATEKMDLELHEKKAAQNSTVNTRLTMTSMAGYFQDRILTQSMMRAMAILYIGPRRQPDFDNDYYLSPIVAPAKYLADFPPVLFTCGEKDPICDDTVVMAGRIRQAKLARQMALKKRGARFGEQLRMSGSTMVEEEEDVDDWVQMRIIEGWSHGYLQMSALLPEVKKVISFLAQWSADAFDDYTEHALTPEQRKSESARLQRAQKSEDDISTPSSSSSLEAKPQPPAQSQSVPVRPKLGVLQPPPTSSDEEDDTEALTFTPKSRRSPSLQSQDSQISTSGRQANLHSRGSPTNSPRFSPSKPSSNLINKIQEQAIRSRPNSFSTVESKVRANAAAAAAHDPGVHSMLLPPPSVPVRRRRSNDHQPPMVGGGGGEGNLVKESSLLERRRLDALGYIGGNAELQDGSHSKHTSQTTNSALDDSSDSE